MKIGGNDVYEVVFDAHTTRKLFLDDDKSRVYIGVDSSGIIQILPILPGKTSGTPIYVDRSCDEATAYITNPHFKNKLNMILNAYTHISLDVDGTYKVSPSGNNGFRVFHRSINELKNIRKFALDFNTAATTLIRPFIGDYCLVTKNGGNFLLEFSCVNTKDSSHKLCVKSDTTVAASFTPKAFIGTGLDAGFRYRIYQVSDTTFEMRRLSEVSSFRQREVYDVPVISISFDRNK